MRLVAYAQAAGPEVIQLWVGKLGFDLLLPSLGKNARFVLKSHVRSRAVVGAHRTRRRTS